jgi:hypothetical protein
MPPATRLTRMAHTLANLAIRDARTIASEGAERVASIFPRWTISIDACIDPVPASLLTKAEEWGADCVFLGRRYALRGDEPSRWHNLPDGRAAGVLLRNVSAAWGALLLRLGHEGYEILLP